MNGNLHAFPFVVLQSFGTGLTVVGLRVVGLRVVGLSVVGLAVVGLSVVGLRVVGLRVVGISVVGLSVVGFRVVGRRVVGANVVGGGAVVGGGGTPGHPSLQIPYFFRTFFLSTVDAQIYSPGLSFLLVDFQHVLYIFLPTLNGNLQGLSPLLPFFFVLHTPGVVGGGTVVVAARVVSTEVGRLIVVPVPSFAVQVSLKLLPTKFPVAPPE